jgi:hypothetical protein
MQDDYGNALGARTVHAMNARLDEGETRMGRIEGDLRANTEATQKIAADTRELVEMFKSFKGAVKVLNWLGGLAKPMAYLAMLGTALIGLWSALKGHLK